MAIVTLPSIVATDLKWSLQTNTQTFSSPLTNTTQRAELPGARWAATLSFKDLKPSEHRVWLSRLARLRGSSGTCYLSPSFGYPLLGAGGGTPRVNGSSQTGTTLVIDGCPANTFDWMVEGDFFSFDNGAGERELKVVVSSVDTNGSGQATIAFEPPIRTAPADNAAIEINAPAAVMRLIDDGQVQWSLTGPRLGSSTIQFIESFPT